MKTLFCCAEPLTDLEIAYTPVKGAAPAPLHVYGARVAEMQRLAPDVMKVVLEVDEATGRARRIERLDLPGAE